MPLSTVPCVLEDICGKLCKYKKNRTNTIHVEILLTLNVFSLWRHKLVLQIILEATKRCFEAANKINLKFLI